MRHVDRQGDRQAGRQTSGRRQAVKLVDWQEENRVDFVVELIDQLS